MRSREVRPSDRDDTIYYRLTPKQVADVNRIREGLRSGLTRLATGEEAAQLWKKFGQSR